jgi:carbon-monoxide dehydrogenase medium subunit
MFPAAFSYAAPDSLDEVIRRLQSADGEAKVLAGGQSLLPLMKLRLAMPTMLVDLRRVPGMRGVRRDNGRLRIGAMTRHADLQFTPELGLLSRAAASIADQHVRNMGTIGGSLSHGDPASNLPTTVLTLDAELAIRGPNGERTAAARDFFLGYLMTDLQPGEVLTEVRIPSLDGYRIGFQKFARRAEDWPIVGVCAAVAMQEEVVRDVRVGLMSMAQVPLRAHAVEAALTGRRLDTRSIAAASEQADVDTDPQADMNATVDYKRHLARVLCRRALEEAAAA